VHITGTPKQASVIVEGGETRSLAAHLDRTVLVVTVDGVRRTYTAASVGQQIWLAGDDGTVLVEEVREAPVRAIDEHGGDAELISPMPGSVVAIGATDGHQVDAGTVVVAVEAMKMEHSLRSPVAGTVQLLVSVGDQVTRGQVLARIVNTESPSS
jgi:acetyl-CoA/propionyl-CoA carboxylase biotin carboxyl carrier protein